MIPTSSPLAPSARRTRALATLAVTATLVLAACGDDDDAVSETTTAAPVAADTTVAADPTEAPATTASEATAATEVTEATEPAGSAGADGEAAVAVGETSLGPALVDAGGMTLYVFIPDAQGPSTCEDDCLDNWPALIGPARAADGVDEGLLGTAARPDGGGDQVTYNDWPLYYFAADIAPGDVNGQGLGDVWYAVDAAGQPIPVD